MFEHMDQTLYLHELRSEHRSPICLKKITSSVKTHLYTGTKKRRAQIVHFCEIIIFITYVT